MSDDQWAETHAFFKLDPKFLKPDPPNTTLERKFLIPGMIKSVFHYQLHAIFKCLKWHTAEEGRNGMLCGDEMGLGKVLAVLTCAIVPD